MSKKIQKEITLEELDSHESIEITDYHSVNGGETLLPILNDETVGDMPVNFSKDRSFWRIIEIKSVEATVPENNWGRIQ